FPATAGSIWKLDAYAMTTCVESPIQPGNGNMVIARLIFKNAAGAEVGAADAIILDQTASLGTWTKHTLMSNAPAGTDSVAAYILFVQPTPTAQGAAWVDDISLYDVSTVGVPDGELVGASLHQNVPNPFNPATRIAFDLPRPGQVEVVIYNLAGREVRAIFSGELPAGAHSVTWDGRTSDGSVAASGTYWYQLRTPDGRTSRSMVLLK
ncbi:MAG: T9SS type A sorting domain-containing protein, partial [Candidatus Eisenbacteria bacterium]|nr:T9SS type A sorting domain-containing protein [Candidatus Eisenbacteria bacterium]